MFLSNWLVFKIVLATVTGLVDYPVAADVLLVYDDANKLYLSGGSLEYVSNVVLYKGETSYEIEDSPAVLMKTGTRVASFTRSAYHLLGGSQDGVWIAVEVDQAVTGAFQMYKGDMTSGVYTEFGSEVVHTSGTTVDGDTSWDGKYVLFGCNSTSSKVYKIAKNDFSSGLSILSTTYASLGNKTDGAGYRPTFVPGTYDFILTGTNNNSTFYIQMYKHNVGTDTWTAVGSSFQPTITGRPTRDGYQGYWVKSATSDGLYLLVGSYGTYAGWDIYKLDWTANSGVWINGMTTPSGASSNFGHSGGITPDGKYIIIGGSGGSVSDSYIYKNNTDGDWTSFTDVTTSHTFNSGFTHNIHFIDNNKRFIGSVESSPKTYYIDNFREDLLVDNYYITQPGTYRADLQICGIDYKTNEVEVTGSITPTNTFPTLTFDGYNQLSLTNTPTYVSSKLTYGSNVYDIGTLTSDITIEKPGEYASLTFDTSSNVAYFSNATVGAMGTTLADYVVDTTIYGTVQSGQTHQIGQGGFGNNTILNADGTRLLITDPLNYPSGRGRAYIYHLENGSWVLKQTWDNPNNTGQRFADGACMNEDGTRIFLMHNASEKVYTYEYTNGAWPTDNTGTHVITVGTNIGAEYEGLACNKAGDVLLMGHGNANTAYIYRRASATSWSQDSGGSFTKGRGVAMNGDGTRAFIGNSTDGTVHMTEWNGSTWSSLTQIIDESYSNWPCTMMSDSVGETLVIVSGNGDSSSGNSGIYERDSGTGLWSRAQGVNADTEIYGMRLPSISYDGTMVLVGSFRYDSSKGRAQLWQKSNGAWTLKKEYLNPDTSPASSDQFGAGCGIARTTKDKFVIGMEGDDTAGTDYGSVYVYNNTIPDFISFDTYNKLSLSGLTNPTSKIHALLTGAETTTVYDIGTATNIYIESEGTYTAEMKGSDGFALVSNVVGTGQISEPPVYSSATPTLVDPIDITDGIWSSGNYEHYQTHSTYYLYALSLDDDDSDRFIKYDWVNLVWSDQDQSGTYSTFGTSATDTTATARSVTNPTHIYLMAGSQLHATMVNPYYQVPNYSPSLTHDTYNKLSIENITPTASTLRLGSNTYDIGTATDIYIEDTGTYEIETKDANTFALVSNVVDTVTQVGAYDSSATPTLVDPIDITDGIWSSLTYQWYQTHSTYYLYKLSGDPNDSDRFIKYDWVNLVWSDQDQSGTYSTFGTSATDTTATARSITNPTHIYLMAGSQLHATMVNPYYQVPNYSPSLTHDTYNKLSIENITPTASTLRLGSNTYDIGTATDIYIEDTGTYEIETKDSNTFAFASNTATYQVHPNTAYSNYRSIGGISAASTSLHNENITTTYSVTMWAKSASATYIVRTANSDTNASGNNTHGIFGINSSGEFSIPSWTSGDSISVSFSGTPDYRDEWHFYGFEFNDTTIKVHIDGATPITGSTGYSGQTHNRMRFDNPNAFTDGTRLAEFAVYNRALSDAEFVSIYNNGLPNGPDNVSSGRVSWFKCLSGAMGTNSGTGGDFDASFTEDTDVPSAWLDPTPSLTHDTYNKLSIENITPISTSLRLGSNTYDIGTATNIYVEDTGTYEIETKSANTFAFASNVVSSLTRIEPRLSECHSASFALTYDGKVYSYGQSAQYQTGLGTTTDISYPTLLSTLPSIKKLHERSPACQNGACISSDGRIFMWGDNTWYTVAGTTNTNHIQTPSDRTAYFGDQTLSSNTVTSICYSRSVGASLTETGNVWTWGGSVSGRLQLGNGSTATSLIQANPGQITFGGVTDNITRLAGGHDHHIALDTDGDVWFWGQIWASGGGLDYPASMGTAESVPQEIMTGNNIVGVSSTFFTLYAWQSDGTYYALGQDTAGQIGDGTATSGGHATWQKIDYFSANNITINEIYGGAYFVFADTSDGYYCWGSGGHGAFGNGGTGNLTSPTKWTNVSNIKVFSAGSYQCPRAITEDGKYYAWGNGGNYKRGDNTTGDISYPKYIDTLPNILAPSFEFDGYDKVFVNQPYEIQIWCVLAQVKSASTLDGLEFTGITPTRIYLPYQNSLYTISSSGMNVTWHANGTEDGYPLNTNEHVATIYVNENISNLTGLEVKYSSNQTQNRVLGLKFIINGVTILEETTKQTADSNYKTSYSFTPSTFSSITKYTKDTHTYDANQAQIITVSDPGTYNAQLSQGGVFSLKSATIPATKASGLYTWAFHHGNFDNAYGDGDILTARDNGRFYADTPSYTGDIGTITAGSSTTSNTTYTFTPASTLTANVLMVAGGGGGGGRYNCGGGGAGGLVYTVGTTLSGTKTIVVGNGDSGGNGGAQSGYNGKDTTFTGLTTAVGGGYGGTHGAAGGTGGSGGGGGGQTGNGPGGSATSGQGFAGGTGSNSGSTFGGGGGGGGAGDVGGNGSDGVGGNGGIGKFFGTGSSYTDFGDEYGEGGYFASGAGGGSKGSTAGGIPGRGGGGYGARYYGYMGIGGSQHALPHTGGGGGGSGTVDRDQHPGYASNGDGGVLGHGGRGGSGIVLLQTNVALPNGSNTAVVQVGNPRRRSLPPTVDYMGSEVNRFSIIDGASMPTYKLPTHWYVDPIGSNSNSVWSTQGAHSLQKRADGGTSNVFYVTSTEGLFEYGHKMAQSADAIFMPVEAQRYNGLLAIGSNSTNDIHFEMAADGTAALYYDNGATLLSAGTIKCFTVGKWHHIALTVDSGGNAVGYVNGYPVVSGTYTSVAAVGSRSGNMHMRVGDHSITFRKFLTYEVSTYNFHMSPKQVLQRAAEVGLGPKLEYDGLNAINVVNAEPGSGTEITIYESNANDTSNLYVVSCNESSYLLSNAGTYYAQIKGTDTFTITRPLTVTDDHFPLYQYPPIDGTTSGLTTSTTADTWNTWTISGAAFGNGTYRAKWSVATGDGTPYNTFRNNVGSTNQAQTALNPTYPIDITLELPSAKTVRKYRMFPLDHVNPYGPGTDATSGTSVDPTLPGNGGLDATKRPKSWILYGYRTDPENPGWESLDTVTDKPISIYGDIYSIDTPGSYQQYKLSVTANNGGDKLLFGDIQLWGDA
jgi:alpha-tubulin suppressor-like RCC1 family protein/flagellar assembly factor FliW